MNYMGSVNKDVSTKFYNDSIDKLYMDFEDPNLSEEEKQEIRNKIFSLVTQRDGVGVLLDSGRLLLIP